MMLGPNYLMRRKLLFPLFLLTFLGPFVFARESPLYQEPSECQVSTNRTFSWSQLHCVACQWKQNDLPNSCPCPSKMREISEAELQAPSGNQLVDKCAICPENSVVYDGRHCLKCGTLNPYNITSGTCQPCPLGHIEVIYNNDGTPKETVHCEKCADGYNPSPNMRSCIPCHPSFLTLLLSVSTNKKVAELKKESNRNCICPEKEYNLIDGVCFPVPDRKDQGALNIDAKNSFKIDYENRRMDSSLFKEHLRLAYLLCREDKQNQTACQILANLCTLNLHNVHTEPSTTACDLYLKSSRSLSNTPAHVPMLYYAEYEAPTLLGKPNEIPHQYNMDFSSHSSDINITTAKFSFDGKFLGLSDLHEHIPCSDPPLVQGISRKFGATYRTQCSMGIQELWAKYKNQEMYFLDPYVSYQGGYNSELKLYNIPVKIANFKRNGLKTNLKDELQWQLVRRFFMVDTIGGYEGESRDGIPSHIRYVSEISLKIQLQNSHEPGRIYVPLMTLVYKDMTKEEFLRNEPINFHFSVNYMMDMSRSLEDVKISVGVISALAVIWAAIQTWSWNRRNGRAEVDIETIANLIIISCGHLADAFFIVCFGTALFWFIFFKKQAVVHVILPDPQQERLLRDLLISAFSLKIIDILKLLSRQSNIDIFFIDWERPKARSTIQAPNERTSRGGGGHDAAAKSEIGLGIYHDKNESVSIWRSYFVANEWNEIHTSRKVNVPVQIIATLFFLEIVGFKYWGLYWPEGTLSPGPEAEHIPYSTTARFAVATLIFGIIGILQWLYRVGFYERFIEDEIQDFVDLCTLGNISVFILAAKQHGYYIHGRSVHGFADTDMQTMIEQLSREEEDLCSRRGLLPQTDQQTFLISVPSTFRNVYTQVLQPLYATSNSATPFLGRGRQLSLTTSKASIGGSGNKPTANMLNLSIHAYHSMNRFLTAFLEHALSDLDYDVKDKSFFETTLDMEFGELGTDRAVFYTDNGHSFDSVLFYGNERTLFIFNLYTFFFVDILSHNFVLAGIVTFVIDMTIKCLRNYLGKRNLARKTLIDSRFLI